MKISTWIKKHTASLNGKTVAISGSTGGIGRELTAQLAQLGANLILLDRSSQRSYALIKELKDKYPSLEAKHIRLDLEDMGAVKAAAKELSNIPLDFLILNAGAYHIPRHKCDTGFDNVFQINFVAPYYLARTLMPKLCARGGRVVAVSSIAHNYSHIDISDVDFSTRSKSSLVYGNAKRYLTYSLYGLFEDNKGLAVTHPGITFTNITAHYPKLIFALIKHPMKVIFMKPRRASLSILSGIFEDCGKNEWIGPSIFNIWGMPKKKKLHTASKEEAVKICKIAEDIYCKLI